MRHLTSSRGDLSTPERLRGLKLRLPQSEAMAAGFEALGAQIQQIPFNQLYVALQTGAVEAEENPIATNPVLPFRAGSETSRADRPRV